MTLYTEKNTSLLYEAKLFDSFVILRPASPGFEDAIRRVSYLTLDKEFNEYAGIHAEVIQHLGGDSEERLDFVNTEIRR